MLFSLASLLPLASFLTPSKRKVKGAVTEQDRLIYALCRRERLLDLVRRFTVFDAGVRKIARHQQYFGIRAAVERVKQRDQNQIRKGGVIWHTQGSGKSLTMVMLGRALALDKQISKSTYHYRDLIETTSTNKLKAPFKSCELEPIRATSGTNLLELIENRTPLITTIINKFETASKARDFKDMSSEIFVLVDESHRTQTGKSGGFGSFAIKMRRLLPNACYLGFTGTPLLKKQKNTLVTFGGLIHKYTIDDAVADGAVVPLLYEGRLVPQEITGDIINQWLEKVTNGLTDNQKADLKRKVFSGRSSLQDWANNTSESVRHF